MRRGGLGRAVKALLKRAPGAWIAAGYLLAGALLGAAWIDPAAAGLAWLAVVALTVTLVATRRAASALLGSCATLVTAHLIGFPWVPAMNRASVPDGGVPTWLFDVVEMVVWTAPHAVVIGAGFWAARLLERRWRQPPVALWLPIAWSLGELARVAFIRVSISDWLTTQWSVEPVLRLVGHLGWWPALWICLFAAAGLGQAIATRRPRWALAALAGLLGLALPPLPERGQDQLRGIAAVTVSDAITAPERAPLDEAPELFVWPEQARYVRPYLQEGRTRGARIRPLLPDSPAAHLVGLVTRAPGLGLHNQLVAVTSDGTVLQSRAKRFLLPVAETRWLGFGDGEYVAGTAPPVLDVAGRRVAAVICGELLSRPLVAEGVDAGGELLVVAARDQMMESDRALRHLLAVQVLRSVEYGVPSVRSSLGGRSAFVSSAGRVLAESPRGDNGFLLWDPARGERRYDFAGRPAPPPGEAAPPAPDVVVLYAAEAPELRTVCPEGRCRYLPLEGFTCPAAAPPATAVIVAGHGQPPTWLSQGPVEVARAVRCFRPPVVVIDTCYGASSELLEALGDLDAVFVGASSLIPGGGLRYDPGFFAAGDPEERAAAVHLDHGELLRWRISQPELAETLAAVAAMPPDAVTPLLVRRAPPYVGVTLGGAGRALIPVPPDRVGPGRPGVRRRPPARAPRPG